MLTLCLKKFKLDYIELKEIMNPRKDKNTFIMTVYSHHIMNFEGFQVLVEKINVVRLEIILELVGRTDLPFVK